MSNASIGTAWIQIKPSLSGISSDIAKELRGAAVSGSTGFSGVMKNTFKGLGDNIEQTFTAAFTKVSSITKGLLTAGIGAATGLIGSQIGSAFSRIDTMNNFPKVMQSLGYSAADAEKSIGTLKQGVLGLPTALDEIVSNTQLFAPISKDLDHASKTAIAFNNALLAGNKPAEEQANAMQMLTKVMGAGEMSAARFMSINAAMPGQMNMVAKSLLGPKANAQQLQDAMANGIITTDDFRDAFIKLNEEGLDGAESFQEQAKNSTDGINSSFANMKTAVTRSLVGVINSIPGFTKSIKGLGEAIEGVLSGTMSDEDAGKLFNDFISGIARTITETVPKLIPIILSGLYSLVTTVADSITKLLSNSEQTSKIIKGFVKLFVAVAKAGAQIAMAIVPLIPEIIATIAAELASPENIGPIAVGMGLLLGGAVIKTVVSNFKKNIGISISGIFDKIFDKNKAADAAADSIDKVSKAVKKAPKTFTFGESIANFFKQIGTALSGLAEAIVEPIKVFLKGLGEALAGFFKAFADPAVLLGALGFAAAAAAIAAAILLIGGAIGIVAPGLANFMQNVVIPFGEFLLNVLLSVIETLTDSIIRLANDAIIPLAQNALIPLIAVMAGAFMSILESVSGVLKTVGGVISDVLTAALKGVKSVVSAVGDAFSKMGSAIKTALDGVSGVLGVFKDIIMAIGNAIIATVALATGRSVEYGTGYARVFAQGGKVVGPGSATSDSIRANLSNGEYVIRTAAARQIGYSNLDKANATGSLEARGASEIITNITINGYNQDPGILANRISQIIALKQSGVMS
jgi:tape measure domain-containing protein